MVTSFASIALVATLAVEMLHRQPRLSQFLSETTMLICIGALANLFFWGFGVLFDVHGVDGGSSIGVARSSTVHDIIYFLLLPPIIFEAGFTLRKHRFFANFGTIMLYAIVGTGISIMTTGMLVYLLSSYDVITTKLTVSQALLFGSLISSTDPVATISILRSSNAPPLLGDLIFGESALNDALSIVFFDLFRKRCAMECTECDKPKKPNHHNHEPLSPPPLQPPPSPPPAGDGVGQVFGQLGFTFGGSLCLGVAVGLLSALLMRRLKMIRRDR